MSCGQKPDERCLVQQKKKAEQNKRELKNASLKIDWGKKQIQQNKPMNNEEH